MLEEKEIWKPFPLEGFEHLYQVSNLGRAWSNRSKKEICTYVAGKYKMFTLSRPEGKERVLVHRAVAVAFVEDLKDDEDNNVVNHIDGVKFNNKASNLEWITLSKNAKHSQQVLGQRKTNKAIYYIDESDKKITFESITLAAQTLKTTVNAISSNLHGKTKRTIHGHKWHYIDESHNTQKVDLTTMTKIKDFPNYYISKEGLIYGLNKRTFLKYNYADGYPKVMLYKNAKYKCLYVHVLVAQTFIPNPNNKKVVNHKDHDKRNCNSNNLEWVASSENNNKYQEYKRNQNSNTSSVLSQSMKVDDGSGENSEVEEKTDDESDSEESNNDCDYLLDSSEDED